MPGRQDYILDALIPPDIQERKRINLSRPSRGYMENDAIAALRQAVAAEDKLAYNEPTDWFVPSRQVLGAALLTAGKAREAEQSYREDLKRNRDNGWSLYGLRAALEAQGNSQAAAPVAKQFAAAWQRADVTLSASAY